MTGIGPVPVRCPRVRDRVGQGSERIRFRDPAEPPIRWPSNWEQAHPPFAG